MSISFEDGAISLEQIQAAHERIKPFIHETPALTSKAADILAGRRLLFKAEIFQKTGSFKARGASNAVQLLPQETKAIVTHSSGNHAAAVAYAAAHRSLPAHIVVPSDTPQIKQNAVKSYNGNLILCQPTIESRESTCAQIQQDTGAAFIPPYNHPHVVCGQGTIALELLEQASQKGMSTLDAIIVPVSGGGMISGIAVAAKSLQPSIKIIAAEPQGRNNAADVAISLKSGQLVDCPKPVTICDGLQARTGSITWPIIKELVDDVVVITEEEVVEAMQFIMERMKVVVEPSGAAGVAAAFKMRGDARFDNLRNVGVVLCGGNVDLSSKHAEFWKDWLL